jgi:hypothetical protein
LRPPYESLGFSIQRVKTRVCLAGVAVCLNIFLSRSSPSLDGRPISGFLTVTVVLVFGTGFMIGFLGV